jgi:hypothetical protein
MEMSVPTIGVMEGASMLITVMPVMMVVSVPKVIPVLTEAVQVLPSSVTMEMVVLLIPVILQPDASTRLYLAASVMKTATVTTVMCAPVKRPVISRLVPVLQG